MPSLTVPPSPLFARRHGGRLTPYWQAAEREKRIELAASLTALREAVKASEGAAKGAKSE